MAFAKVKVTNTARCWLLAAVAIGYVMSPSPSLLDDVPPLTMTKDERAHILSAFTASAPPASNVSDTVWSRRVYAPMHIHTSALHAYRKAIETAFPEHTVTFDVVFAAGEGAVPWHTDYDSLGPFDADWRSIACEDFITVHANLLSPEDGGGQLRTLDSLTLAVIHFMMNRVTNSFGSLAALTELLAVGVRTHDPTPGAGNAFNNLKTHEVTAGQGRISYVVRLVRKDVLLLADQIRESASGGTRSTRRIAEFERFIPLLGSASKVAVGTFPWSRVDASA